MYETVRIQRSDVYVRHTVQCYPPPLSGENIRSLGCLALKSEAVNAFMPTATENVRETESPPPLCLSTHCGSARRNRAGLLLRIVNNTKVIKLSELSPFFLCQIFWLAIGECAVVHRR